MAFPGDALAALFQVISRRHLKTSIAFTTDRGITSRGSLLGETIVTAATLDRLLDRSVVLPLEGHSYQLCCHQARAQNLRKTTDHAHCPPSPDGDTTTISTLLIEQARPICWVSFRPPRGAAVLLKPWTQDRLIPDPQNRLVSCAAS